MSIEQELVQLKEGIEKAKTARTKAEVTIENLTKRKGELTAECTALGLKPEELEAEIVRLNASIEENLAKAKAMIPAEFLVDQRVLHPGGRG